MSNKTLKLPQGRSQQKAKIMVLSLRMLRAALASHVVSPQHTHMAITAPEFEIRLQWLVSTASEAPDKSGE